MQWEPGKQYRISYTNESRETSVRTIDVLQTSQSRDGVLYIRAYCHLRGMERTFRADRVTAAERVQSAISASGQSSPYHAAVPPSAVAAEAPRNLAPVSAHPSSSTYSPAGRIALAGLGIMIGIVLLVSYYESMPGSAPSPFGMSASGSSSTVPVKPASRPAPPPKPALEEVTIGGYLLRTIRSNGLERFEVPELGIITMDKLEAVAAIRLPAFVKAMGFFDAELVSRYLDADLNGSGRLSFDELKVFQQKTYREFRYESNKLALRPDEFLAAGGGDCEDFALYTAGLLRFWGWEPYLGSLASSKSAIGHAVCLSYEEGAFPKGYEYFRLDGWTTEDGSPLRDGTYVPIDYDQVGSLSNAVEPGWKLRSVYIPEKAWGLSM